MFFVVLGHGAVPHKRVVAPGSGAVKVSVDFVVVADGPAAVDHPFIEFKPFKDGDVVVKFFSVYIEHVQHVCGHVAELAATVVVVLVFKHTFFIGAGLWDNKFFEAVDYFAVFITQVVHEGYSGVCDLPLCQVNFRDFGQVVFGIFWWTTSALL